MTIATSSSGHLRHLGVLRFVGTDAGGFLQGQISNDTRRLAESKTLFAAYSSPQGRVLALLHLLPHSTGIVAILPRELVLPTLHAMRKFVLRAKVEIEDASELLWVVGQYGAGACTSSESPTDDYREHQGVGSAAVTGHSGNSAPGRRWVLGSPESLTRQGLDHAQADPDAIQQRWRLADVRAGLPQIYGATREAFVAQMLNLDLLQGISFSKGCYTGQEIIARTQHLGRIKRRLYRLRLPEGTWMIGQALRLTDGRAGRLVEVARAAPGFEALAVLNVESSPAGGGEGSDATAEANLTGEANGAVAAIALPLPYSLS